MSYTPDTPLDDAFAQVAYAFEDGASDLTVLHQLPDSLFCEEEDETEALIHFLRLAWEASRQGFELHRRRADYNTPPEDVFRLQQAALEFFGHRPEG